MSEFSNVSLSEIGITEGIMPIRQSLILHLMATTGLFDSNTGGSPVTTNGAYVKRWEDQSGAGNHFVNYGGNGPALITSAQNSLPIVRFVVNLMYGSTFFNTASSSFFVAFKNNDQTDGSYIFCSGNTRYIGIVTRSTYNASGRDRFTLAQTDGVISGGGPNGTLGKLAFSGGSAGSNFIVGSCFGFPGVPDIARLNGVAGGNVATPLYQDSNFSFNDIGKLSAPCTINADIGEILIYDRVLGESERQLTELYLRYKWAAY